MRIKIINPEIGIGACNMEDIPAGEGSVKYPLNELPFFYFKERDWIVLVEEHPFYEPLRGMISTYLELDGNQRNIFTEQVAADNFLRSTIDVLDEVIKYRERKEGKKDVDIEA